MAENTAVQVTEQPQKMEFRLISPTEDGFPKRIEWNREELERAVRAKVAEYTGIVYTEETIQEAKKDRAELNKLSKAIEDSRKKIKGIINEPYLQFEKEIKEVVGLISKQSALIDGQVKEYEETQRNERRNAVISYMLDAIRPHVSDIAEEDILQFYDSKWENVKAKKSEWKGAADALADRIASDLKVVDGVEDEFFGQAYQTYRDGFSLSKAMNEVQKLRKQKEMILENERRRREAEEARKAQEEARMIEQERRKLEEEQRRMAAEETRRQEQVTRKVYGDPAAIEDDGEETEVQTTAGDASTAAPAAPNPAQKQYKASFTIYGTKDQIMAVREFMVKNNIRFGKVEK